MFDCYALLCEVEWAPGAASASAGGGAVASEPLKPLGEEGICVRDRYHVFPMSS